LRFLRLTRTIVPMNLKRHTPWLTAALVFGAAILPFLVYYTGAATLGPYANGGPGRFVADLYADLARLRGPAWALLLGPVAVVAVWRVLLAYASQKDKG
jgi:hypothetical protein